jgi:predicted amidohydrolase
MRIAGAQIPVSRDLDTNVAAIKRALDFAGENKADYLLTPEGSLTGYFRDFDTYNGRTFQDIKNACSVIVDYAKDKNVGLFLGTMWIEHEHGEPTRRNQIRVYDTKGNYVDHFDKLLVLPYYENVRPADYPKFVYLPEFPYVKIQGMICNDLWGSILDRGPCLAHWAVDTEINLVVHATNGNRNNTPIHDDVFGDWHNAYLKMMSLYMRVPIVTADNSIQMDGSEYNGITSSESGVCSHGVWLTEVPRKGEQYFVHEFNPSRLLFR